MSKYHTQQVGFVPHVEINVIDLNKSIPFYTQTLGFQVLSQGADSAMLGTEDKQGIVSLRQLSHGRRNAGRTAGLYHFAILLPTRKDLGVILTHFIKNRVPLQGASNHGISEAIYLADPDGNGIEIAVDTNPNTWPSFDRSMEWFAVNGPMDVDAVLQASENEVFTKLPMGTVLGHVHLHVGDLAKAKEFYKEGLGMDVVMEFPESALFMSYGQYHHHIAVNLWNGRGVKQPSNDSTGIHYFDLLLPNKDIVKHAIDRLQNLGYPSIEENGVYSIQDPSGNHIRIAA